MRQLMLLAFAAGLILSAPAAHATKPGQTLPIKLRADKVLVIKHKRQLHLMWRGKIVRTYKVALGFAPKGHKRQEGDGKTPEGNYVIDWRNAKSRFNLSLHINYPKRADRTQARRRGVSPGGEIFIHGLPKAWSQIGKAHALRDWTLGCIAVTNTQIREIWRAVRNGTPIEIRP